MPKKPIQVMLTDAERQLLTNRATAAGKSLSAYARHLLLNPIFSMPKGPEESVKLHGPVVYTVGTCHKDEGLPSPPTFKYKPARDCSGGSRCIRLRGACSACKRRDAAL